MQCFSGSCSHRLSSSSSSSAGCSARSARGGLQAGPRPCVRPTPAPAPSISASTSRTPHLVLLPPPAAAAAVADTAAEQREEQASRSRQQGQQRNQQQEGPSSHATAASTSASSHQEYAGATFSRDYTHSWVAQAVPSIVKCLTEQRALLERSGADSMCPLTPMVEWVYSRPGGLEFQAQQLAPEQWDPKSWRDWSRSSSNGAAGMVFVRPIASPMECPLHPGEARPSSSSSSGASSSAAPSSEPCTQRSMSSLQDQAAELGLSLCDGEVPELQGHVDVDNCCSKTQAKQQQQQPSTSSGDVEHHSPPYFSHIVPFHDRTAGSHTVGSSSHITDAVGLSSGGAYNGYDPGSIGSSAMELGMPGARSRRRFRARLRSSLDSAAASAAAAAGAAQQRVAYYGLVAQSAQQGAAKVDCSGSSRPPSLPNCVDGCYVLKTTQNMDTSGCTCTLFTLTRVCHTGPSLYQQLQESWLSLA